MRRTSTTVVRFCRVRRPEQERHGHHADRHHGAHGDGGGERGLAWSRRRRPAARGAWPRGRSRSMRPRRCVQTRSCSGPLSSGDAEEGEADEREAPRPRRSGTAPTTSCRERRCRSRSGGPGARRGAAASTPMPSSTAPSTPKPRKRPRPLSGSIVSCLAYAVESSQSSVPISGMLLAPSEAVTSVGLPRSGHLYRSGAAEAQGEDLLGLAEQRVEQAARGPPGCGAARRRCWSSGPSGRDRGGLVAGEHGIVAQLDRRRRGGVARLGGERQHAAQARDDAPPPRPRAPGPGSGSGQSSTSASG